VLGSKGEEILAAEVLELIERHDPALGAQLADTAPPRLAYILQRFS
jgi:hypothetical protein